MSPVEIDIEVCEGNDFFMIDTEIGGIYYSVDSILLQQLMESLAESIASKGALGVLNLLNSKL